jgi:hypothetical protein
MSVALTAVAIRMRHINPLALRVHQLGKVDALDFNFPGTDVEDTTITRYGLLHLTELPECLRPCFRNGLVLLARTTADADCADYNTCAPQRHTAGKNHHAPAIGGVNAEELTAGLRVLRKILGADIEGASGERL